jgi:hypothetical protein
MQLPQLGGYFGTTTKTNATLTISADDKNRPIVAEWQPPESLGYVTVYMSDLGTKKDWSENWYNEKEGKILVIRPSEFIDISRTETDRKIMQEMYNLGIKDAENKLNEIINYLNQ